MNENEENRPGEEEDDAVLIQPEVATEAPAGSKTGLIIGIVVGVVLLIGLVVGGILFKQAQDKKAVVQATRATIQSIIDFCGTQKNGDLEKLGIKLERKWIQLDAAQHKALLQAAENAKRLNLAPGMWNGEKLVDPWGQDVAISLYNHPDGYREVLVYSHGPDKLAGKREDITMSGTFPLGPLR